MRTEFDMMGRSESRDGWRAMSAVRMEGDRDYLRCWWSGAGSMGSWVFRLGDGQISRDRLRAESQARIIG